MAREIKNIGASVRARLLQLAKASGRSFELVLIRFALERLLFRLSRSRHADRFVLKGAMLMTSWFDDPHRSTRDLDLLAFGDPSPEPMLATFREILAQAAADGVEFAGLSINAGFSDGQAEGLRARNGHRRKVPGDGRAGTREQSDEGLLRYLDSRPVIQF